MLPSFRTLFGPDVLPKPAIPPSLSRPHVSLRPNDPPSVPSVSSTASAASVDASWHREQQQQPLGVPNDTAATAPSHQSANHTQHLHDNWGPHMTQQSPPTGLAQPPTSSASSSHTLSDHREPRPHSSSPSPSHSQSFPHSTSHPDIRDRDSGYSARLSASASSLPGSAPQQSAPFHASSYTQGHHAPASMHYRSSTLDSAVSSVSSPPHPTAVGSEMAPSAMEAMAAMTISSTRSSQAVVDGADARADTSHRYDTNVVPAGYQGQSTASGSDSVPHSPSRSLVRLSIAENRGLSVSPPRRSNVEPAPLHHDRHVSRTTPPPYHDRSPSLLGAEFHPPSDMDVDHMRTTTRETLHEHDQYPPHARSTYPPTSLSHGSPGGHVKQLPPPSQWTASSALQTTGPYSPKDHAFHETLQSSHRPTSVHASSYPSEARTSAPDDASLHHRPGHYPTQAYSQPHPSLHDQPHHQRMHDPVRVSDQRTHPSYHHPSSSISPATSSPSSRPAPPPYSSSFPAQPHPSTPTSPHSPPPGHAWAPAHQSSVPEGPLPPGPQQALSPRLSKNHDGLVHRSSHSSLAHHPDRFATSSPSLRGGHGANYGHSSGQHLRQVSAGLPSGHASRSVSDHVVSPTVSYAYPHSPAHASIRRPHSARPISESHSYASNLQDPSAHQTHLSHVAGSHDYPGSHVSRPSPYPPRRRTESVPSSPQFSHSRADRSWAEPYRHDVYGEKFSRHQRSNTTHGHVGDSMYESFSKVLASSSASSELRDRPPFQPSASMVSTSQLAPPTHDPRKATEAPGAGYPAVRPSASEPDLERVYGGRPAAQTNRQADYWAKSSFGTDERQRSDRLPEARGQAMQFRKDIAQEEHIEQEEADCNAADEDGEEDGEEEEEGQDDDEGEDDDIVERAQHGQHAWPQQDYDDVQGRMHHPLNREGYRYGESPYASHQSHGHYGDGQHPSEMDGSIGHPPLYAPHPYQPLQQYLLRPQRAPKSPKQKPLQPKNSQRGPYLTRQRVLASGMEPGKGTTCRYVCSYCQKRFSRPSSLRIHTYSHTGERPFKCTEKGCERQFSVQSNMRRHLRVHRMDKIKFLDPIYPSQIASERPPQARPQQQQPPPPSQPQHPTPVDHRMAPPLPLIGTTVPTPIHS